MVSAEWNTLVYELNTEQVEELNIGELVRVLVLIARSVYEKERSNN
ncbi:MAG: hypothetical protein AAB966_03625 [Patescibacteria group bacterium]